MVRRALPLPLRLLLCALLLPGCGTAGDADSATGPTVTAAHPVAGFTGGGNRVTITGTGFSSQVGVTIAGASATNVTVLDATTLVCTAPAGPAGPAAIEVTAAGDTGRATAYTYVAYPPTPALDVPIRRDTAVDGQERRPANAPMICCDEGSIYVVWADGTGAGSDVYFQRSTDRGSTWLPQDVRLNSNPVGASTSLLPQVCCSGSKVYVAWYDTRDPGPVQSFAVYVNRSTDAGTTWLADDVQVSPPQGTVGAHLRMCCDGDDVHLVWSDTRDVTQGTLFVNSSTDAGVTWQAEDSSVSSVGVTMMNPAYRWGQPQICCSGPHVYVTWADTRNGSDADLWCVSSADRGATWGAEARVDRDNAEGNATSAIGGLIQHVMCCEGERVHVVWEDDRGAGAAFGTDLYANTSQDGGLTFRPADVRVNPDDLAAMGLRASQPRICCEGDTLHVSWRDDRVGDDHVYYNRSLDGGATFQPFDARLDEGTGVLTGPYLACCSGHVHVCWTDGRDAGEGGVFVNTSADAGAAWLAAGVRLDRDVPSEAALPLLLGSNSGEQPLCCAGAYAFVVWWEDRNAPGESDRDLFFGRYD